jgi:hypothetical protein
MMTELAFLSLVMPELQAGGGGSFGGGGGGGGSSGGGDGIGYLIYWLIRLAIEYPPLGVPLLIGAVTLLVVGSRRGWWRHQERTIRRSKPLRRAYVSNVSSSTLKANDPAFEETRFLARVKLAFEKAQTSWCEQELDPLRPFVSDGVFERFSLQVEEQIGDGWRQGMQIERVGPLTIIHVDTGPLFDTITVRIPFRADIHRLDRETGKKLAGSTLPRREFAECWSFVRRRGAKTTDSEGLLEGKCPNCAAPLTMKQSARCTHCECLARSGQFDWVLTEITQASEWNSQGQRDTPGLAAYAAHDPGLSVQLLEDRASVAFWRKCAADRAGDTLPLTRLATSDFAERYAERIAPKDSRRYMTDCAVGAVHTIGLLEGAEHDRAAVEVVWDGRVARVNAEGRRKVEPARILHRTLFVLGRKAGELTNVEETFTTMHCQSCGAHDLGGTDASCSYCGAARTGDATTWLVEEVLDRKERGAQSLTSELALLKHATTVTQRALPSGSSAAGLLAWSIALAASDGRVDDKERAALHSLAERVEVPAERLDEMLERASTEEAAPPPDPAQARLWLRSLTELALADGHLSRPERKFLRRAAEGVGLGRRELEHALRVSRATLYRESKAARRFEKQRSRSPQAAG